MSSDLTDNLRTVLDFCSSFTPRRQLLEQHQAKVLEQIEALQQNLTHISSKIAHYKEQEKALKMTNHPGETEYMK